MNLAIHLDKFMFVLKKLLKKFCQFTAMFSAAAGVSRPLPLPCLAIDPCETSSFLLLFSEVQKFYLVNALVSINEVAVG